LLSHGRAVLVSRRRAIVVGVFALLALVVRAAGVAVPGGTFVVYGVWLAWAVAHWGAMRVQRTARDSVRLQTAGFVADLTFLTGLCVTVGGAWWLGPTFHCFIVAFACAALPRRQALAVTILAAAGFVGLVAAQAWGLVPPRSIVGLPSLAGRFPAAAVAAIVGLVALAATAALQQSFVRAMRRAQERYRVVARATSEAIYEWDIATGTLDWSDAAEAVLGHPLSAVRRDIAWWEEHIHPEDRARVGASLTAAVEGTATNWEDAYRFLRADRAYAHVVDRGHIIRGPDGKAAHMIGAVADVTEQHEAAEELRRAEEQLRMAQRLEAVGQLAGGVAHDFNNVLTVIQSYAQMLRDDLGRGNPLQDDVDEITKAAERAASLTRQLLAFSRKQVLQPRVLDVNAVVTNMEKMLRPLVGIDVALATSLATDLRPVRADPGQLEQVVMNLVVNARDAMPDGGRVTIETANAVLDDAFAAAHGLTGVPPGPYAMLAVHDTGHGMNEATRARIFEPFFTTKQQGKGTGLGLATVYGIVKQSGGYIWVYSEVGRGTVFKVYLPCARAGDLWEEGEGPLDGRGVHRPATVLLAEDEPALRAVARRALENHGYRVLEAGDGEEALALCARHDGTIDLLLTDVVMPRLGGPELAARVRPTRPELKVLYTSGYTEAGLSPRRRLDADGAFLQKPYTPGALAEKVRAVLAG
jgi:PAS domain S-box-containing protein